ncbi:MAG TPA: response regulator, partial [Candidatus Tripitaka sp. YC43]
MIKTTKTSLHKRTVLIADDEPEIIKFLRGIFVKEGYRVISVSNGRDVLKKVKKGGIDLAILDVIMPVMSGMETLRELRKTAPRLPVIVVTGYGDLQSV